MNAEPAATSGVIGRLSALDRLLPVWILAAMVAGLLGGWTLPSLGVWLQAISADGVSLPIALDPSCSPS